MKLTDLKRLTARKTMEVSFPVPDGMECVVDSAGVARIPGLKAPPGFNLDQCVAEAESFTVRAGAGAAPRRASRAEVEQLVASLSGAAPAAPDHDE